ncbi:hypothetical protein BV22DRAFT_1128801 [Leucogyrophana mollusca]|uniref:Uncharacterized protein n=1 Tax=Leucogyrophana mollusca TaxID=85980 RepID=A0ACB8BJV8_9AGAM|nr:hypothetical protein BV22DRAFT_1128801 [Leucogyrophana mollusca]
MPTVFTQTSSHAEEKKKSYINLVNTCKHAAHTTGYSSEVTRKALQDACCKQCNNEAYPWQLDAAKAFYLGMDCTVLAGTGFGKSLPFSMPSLVNKDKVAIVLTPLNSLEEDQGLDIPDIDFVVQFGLPSSLTVWLQRAGRAGRAIWICARTILLVEASMFKRVGVGTAAEASDGESEEEEEEVTYRKQVEPALREWIETKHCRRDVGDKLFNNPPGRLPPTGNCCDNCSRLDAQATLATPSPQSLALIPTLHSPASSSSELSSDDETPSSKPNTSGKRPMEPTAEPRRDATRRTQDHLQAARTALQSWRIKTRERDFPHSSFTAALILPDQPLTTIASNRHLTYSLDELKQGVSGMWALVDRYGQDVIDVLKRLDDEDKALRHAKKQANCEARRQANEAARSQRVREKACEEEKTRCTKQLAKEKENCSIPGTSCFELSYESSHPNLHRPPIPATPASSHIMDMQVIASSSPSTSVTARPAVQSPSLTFKFYTPPRLPLSPRKTSSSSLTPTLLSPSRKTNVPRKRSKQS